MSRSYSIARLLQWSGKNLLAFTFFAILFILPTYLGLDKQCWFGRCLTTPGNVGEAIVWSFALTVSVWLIDRIVRITLLYKRYISREHLPGRKFLKTKDQIA